MKPLTLFSSIKIVKHCLIKRAFCLSYCKKGLDLKLEHAQESIVQEPPKANEIDEFDIDFDNVNKRKDNCFKYGELILANNFNRYELETPYYSAKLIKLQKNGIFNNQNLDIFHEHIIERSKVESSVCFKMHSTAVCFKRPTLYEYVTYKHQTAVASHYSVIALVPMLLELNKNSKVLECGTGSGAMTLFLSERLGHSGVLHSFDLTEFKKNCAKQFFKDWKESYDLSASNEYEKWPSNVKYGTLNFCSHKFDKSFCQFYDAIYLDMAQTDKGVLTAYELLKVNGVIVINVLHLSQLIKCLNSIRKSGIYLRNEIVIEPSNRFWELRKIKENQNPKDSALNEANQIGDLDWTCRLEDKHVERFKRGGLFYNYWSGFLVRLRKTK